MAHVGAGGSEQGRLSLNHTCHKSMFGWDSPHLEISFVFRQNTGTLTSLGKVTNQTIA